MNLSQEWTAFLIALVGYAILLLPVAYTALRAYLQSRTNAARLDNTPTHAEVQANIRGAIATALASNGQDTPPSGGMQ